MVDMFFISIFSVFVFIGKMRFNLDVDSRFDKYGADVQVLL